MGRTRGVMDAEEDMQALTADHCRGEKAQDAPRYSGLKTLHLLNHRHLRKPTAARSTSIFAFFITTVKPHEECKPSAARVPMVGDGDKRTLPNQELVALFLRLGGKVLERRELVRSRAASREAEIAALGYRVEQHLLG